LNGCLRESWNDLRWKVLNRNTSCLKPVENRGAPIEELGKATLPVSRRKDATEDMAAAGMKVRIVVIPDQETAGPRSESVGFKES